MSAVGLNWTMLYPKVFALVQLIYSVWIKESKEKPDITVPINRAPAAVAHAGM